MRLPAFLCLACLCACSDQGAVSDQDLVTGLVVRLDEDFNRRDAETYLGNFEPENRHLYQTLEQRIRPVLDGPVQLERRSEILEIEPAVNDRIVALVKSITRAVEDSSSFSLVEYAYLVSKLEGGEAVGTFMVEVDNALLEHTAENSFRCPACNYEVSGADGWLAVAHRKDRTSCMEAISFYYLGADLSLDVTVFLDAEASPAEHALRNYLDLIALDRGAEVPPDVEIAPWQPAAFTDVDPPQNLDGARADLRLPGDQPHRLHLATLGALRYLLVLRGDDLEFEQARKIVASFQILDPDVPLEELEARPIAEHTGGSFEGETYSNPRYRVTLTGPEGWTHSMATFGCLFELTFRCPEGRGKLWVTAYGPQPGLSSWQTRVADPWLERYFAQKEMVITESGKWHEDPETGFQLRDLRTGAPRSSEVRAPRMIRLAMAEDLLVVLQGYVSDEADRELIEESFATLGRAP